MKTHFLVKLMINWSRSPFIFEEVRMSPGSRKTVSVVMVAVWMAALLSLNLRLIRERVESETPADEPPFIWPPDLYRALTFGQLPAAVDGLLLKFLVEDNIKHVEDGVRARVYYFLDLATDLDPAFFTLYTAGSNFLAVVRNDKLSALKLITKGENFRKNGLAKYPESVREEYWADEWRIPFIKGYIHLFEMNDIANAARSYRELDHLKNVPIGAQGLSGHFGKPGGIYEIGLSVLKNMEEGETDENVRREIERKKRSLSLSLELFRLNAEFKTFHGDWEKFRREKSIDGDGFGGKVFLGPDGVIDSTTPRIVVLGIR